MTTTIKAKTATPAAPSNPPKCPVHEDVMYFDAPRLEWACPNRDCSFVAHNWVNDKGVDEAMDPKTAYIARGTDVEFVVYESKDGLKQIFIRSVEDNVLINITQLTQDRMRTQPDGGVSIDLWQQIVVAPYTKYED